MTDSPADAVERSRFDEALMLLGRCLANNHLHAALRTVRAPRGVLSPGSTLPQYNRRVVVVVGAGASKEAGLPLANESKELLRKNLVAPRLMRNDSGRVAIPPASDVHGLRARLQASAEQIPEDIVEGELRKLAVTSGFALNDFEAYLLALSATAHGARLARQELVRQFQHRYRPLLSYEILAHLLKHRFIDAVINFNFDELLDQAIRDELRQEEYESVLSDGDYDPSRICEDTVLERPFYIKPHGTVSHPSTLRFTRIAYYEIPQAIFKLIDNLLAQKPLDLIVMGFSMKSPELLQILKERNKNLRVFYMDRRPWQLPQSIGGRPSIHNLDLRFAEHSPSCALALLWKRVTECFEKPYTPRNIARHELVSTVFGMQGTNDSEAKYLWDRTIVEACFAIVRGRGFVSLSSLITDRVGYYYEEFRKHVSADDVSPHTLFDLCRLLGMRPVSFGEESLVFETVAPKALIVPTKGEQEFLWKLVFNVRNNAEPSSNLSPYIEPAYRRHGVFMAYLRALFRGGESEIRLDAPRLFRGTKRHVTHLTTRTALRYHTLRMIEAKRWRSLLVVSEGGEWLLNADVVTAIGGRTVKLIVADETHRGTLEALYGAGIEIRRLHWWLHNQHLTLTQRADRRPIKCVHLSRRLRTPDLRPVLIEGEEATFARNTFIAYWIRAGDDTSRWIDPDEIDCFDDF